MTRPSAARQRVVYLPDRSRSAAPLACTRAATMRLTRPGDQFLKIGCVIEINQAGQKLRQYDDPSLKEKLSDPRLWYLGERFA